MDRIEIREATELNKGYPDGIPNDLTVTLADGRTLRKRVDHPRGHYRDPMTDEEVERKFRMMAKGVISPRTADKVLEAAWKMDKLGDIAPLLEFKVQVKK